MIFLRVLRLLVLAGMFLVVLFAGQCVHDGDREARQGRKWCEGVIAIFEADRAKFLTKHAKHIHHGMLVVRPSAEDGPASGDFVVDRSGRFACRYWQGGPLFAQGHQYTSERRRWLRID